MSVVSAARTPEDCRKFARVCEKQADEIIDPVVKTTLLDLAKQWREMALLLEQEARQG